MKIGIIGISIGMAVMILTVGIVLGFKNEITQRITGLTTDIAISNVTINPGNEPEPIRISKDSLAIIKSFDFVQHVQATTFKNGLLKTETENEGVLLKGVDKDYDFSFLKAHLVSGKLPDLNGAEAGKDIFISQSLADKLNLKLQDKVSIYFLSQHNVIDSASGLTIRQSEQRSRKFSVCGIFKTDFTDFDEKLSLVDIRHLQKINYWDSCMVGNYEIKLKRFENIDANLEVLKNLMGYKYSVNSVKEIYANIFIWLEKLDVNGVIIVVLMILVATINMITALLILILERTNMIGLLKALGMSNPSVRNIFLRISYRLIGKGLIWGNVIGIGLCLLQYYFRWVKLDGETYYVNYVAIQINWLY
ncbi:MAG: ABC transporter permease, partial [Bacteroidota bacterium]